ncbi:inositol monophosphatase [Pokkaliibacter plantistimulans]|uniref:Inositol monophosphatase n=2 Tax=Pseudomonadota TaxID=1224 RepID=A0A2S5KNF8_9PROT|nr:inositol monophosphatase [Pokkaliibacter plantistimulans]
MQPMLNIALRAARIASENLVRSLERLDLVRAEGQDVNKFVMETCQRAEQSIARTILKAFPQHSINGRASGVIQTATGEHIEAEWTINSLDGELNYSRNLPSFALSLTAKIRGKVEHVLVINPVTGDEFTASRGRGAQLNGRRIRLSNRAQLDKALIGITFDNVISNRHLLSTYLNVQRQLMMGNAHVYQCGSALLEMAALAAGQLDAIVMLNRNEIELDAGTLLLQEAGALLGDLNGNPSYRNSGHVMAANPKLFKALTQSLQSAASDLQA